MLCYLELLDLEGSSPWQLSLEPIGLCCLSNFLQLDHVTRYFKILNDTAWS